MPRADATSGGRASPGDLARQPIEPLGRHRPQVEPNPGDLARQRSTRQSATSGLEPRRRNQRFVDEATSTRIQPSRPRGMALGQGHPGDSSGQLATAADGDGGTDDDGAANEIRSVADPGARARPVEHAGLARRTAGGGYSCSWPDWLACVLSWWWACDSYSAAIMTDRLMTADRSAQRRPLPESVAPPDGTWMRSTAQHLAHWAIFLSRCRRRKRSFAGGDRGTPGTGTRGFAAQSDGAAGPGTARTAREQHDGLDSQPGLEPRCGQPRLERPPAAGRGQEGSRPEDVQPVARDRRAPASRSAAPCRGSATIRDVPRYLLPGEERVRDIVRELLSRNEWTFAEWSAALPDSAMVRLAAARLLARAGPERGRRPARPHPGPTDRLPRLPVRRAR